MHFDNWKRLLLVSGVSLLAVPSVGLRIAEARVASDEARVTVAVATVGGNTGFTTGGGGPGGSNSGGYNNGPGGHNSTGKNNGPGGYSTGGHNNGPGGQNTSGHNNGPGGHNSTEKKITDQVATAQDITMDLVGTTLLVKTVDRVDLVIQLDITQRVIAPDIQLVTARDIAQDIAQVIQRGIRQDTRLVRQAIRLATQQVNTPRGIQPEITRQLEQLVTQLVTTRRQQQELQHLRQQRVKVHLQAHHHHRLHQALQAIKRKKKIS